MVNLSRMFKDYTESGALHALIPIQSAVGNGVFLTKSGDLAAFIRLIGADAECRDPDEIDSMARRFESALRVFGEDFRLYQYCLKRGSPPIPSEPQAHPVVEEARTNRLAYLASKSEALYSLETFMVVVYEGWRPQSSFKKELNHWLRRPAKFSRESLSLESTLTGLQRELDAAQERMTNKVANFVAQLSDFAGPRILDSQSAFAFLRRLLNYAPFKAEGVRLKYNAFVDFQACNSSLECHRDYLRLDDYYAFVLTLKEPPARTLAHMLRGLAELPGQFIVTTEWRRQTAAAMRRLIHSKRRHFHNSKSSFLNYLNTSEAKAPGDVLIDDGAVAMVSDLGACLEEMEAHGRSFGEFSLTIVLYNEDLAALRRAAAQAFKVFAVHDAQLIDERHNRLNGWLAVLPGNTAFNVRKLWFSSSNYADWSFLFNPRDGGLRNEHLAAEYLAVLEATGPTPYFFNLHYKDVAHTLILGATGSGKSFLLNFLLTHLQKYAPLTTIFDLGGSYEWLTRLFGGSALAVRSAARGFTINPFALPPTSANRLFLLAFVRVLIESGGGRLSADDEKDLYEQIENLYAVAADQRRLFTLANIVRRSLRGPLQKWVQGGPYGDYFDHAEDTLTMAPFQTFDFAGMDPVADVLEPLLFYILHRANARSEEAGPAALKVFVMDEAWRFFRNPVIKNYIVEALKTWRKNNAAMLLATQSAEDLIQSAMLPVVAESCPTRLFLANPGMDKDAYRRAFGLTETEVERIAGLIPKQQMLLKQPDLAKLLSLNVDRRGYWLYTNNPPDNQRRREVFERRGFREGLEILSKEN